MGSVAYFLALVFLVHPLVGEQDKIGCTQSTFFNCGKLSNLIYPFTSSAYPKCGPFPVSGCNDTVQKIQLGRRWYEIQLISQSGSVLINDPILTTLLTSRSCEYFDDMKDLGLASVPFVSLQVLENRTMLRCERKLDIPPRRREAVVHVSCDGYTIYYFRDRGGDYWVDGVSGECSVIHLPVNTSNQWRSEDDLFGVLSAKFYLQASVSMDCWQCIDRGGHCITTTKGKLRCAIAKAEKGMKLHFKLLVLAISAAGIGTLLTILVFLVHRRYSLPASLLFWKGRGKEYDDIEALLRACGSLCPKRYSYLEVKKMTDSFRDKLGEGGFGGVYKGKLQNNRLVAVKVLKGSKGNGEDFINEVSSISMTSHVNIVTLLGFCFEGPKRALVYEFMPKGSLEKFIYEKGNATVNRVLEWGTLFRIAVGIARGLEYLHLGCNTRILHFDIKPHNILLDEEFCPKISDFGLAKVCPRKESIVSMLGARGTVGYIAPEIVCRNLGGVSHKSDVYSYGMMVLEMVGGRRNVDCQADETSEIYFPHWIYNRLVSEEGLGVHGTVNSEEGECAKKMVMVSLWCIQTEPSKRPSMSGVVEMLEGKVELLQNPPKPPF